MPKIDWNDKEQRKSYNNDYNRKRYSEDQKYHQEKLAQGKKWRQTHPIRARELNRRRNWKHQGMDVKAAEQVYYSSNHCAICGRKISGKDKNVDHNHKTGKVRGVLCFRCNRIVGYVENYEYFAKVKAYLGFDIQEEGEG
jgi:hypothetical protein